MASTCFVGAPAALRAPVVSRRGSKASARTAPVTRAEGETATGTVTVTPATVAVRSGSASIKGTVRKQNEDRFASYVSSLSLTLPPPPHLSLSLARDVCARGKHPEGTSLFFHTRGGMMHHNNPTSSRIDGTKKKEKLNKKTKKWKMMEKKSATHTQPSLSLSSQCTASRSRSTEHDVLEQAYIMTRHRD